MIRAKLEIPSFIKARFLSMDKRLREGLISGMKKGMFLAEKSAKESFNKPGNIHVKTGYLRRSIGTEVRTSGRHVVGIIGSDVIYAPVHERSGWVGRHRATFVRARPFLRPAITENLREIRTLIQKEIIREVDKK